MKLTRIYPCRMNYCHSLTPDEEHDHSPTREEQNKENAPIPGMQEALGYVSHREAERRQSLKRSNHAAPSDTTTSRDITGKVKDISPRVAPATVDEYDRYSRKFGEWAVAKEYVSTAKEIYSNPPRDTAYIFCEWINEHCDVVDINNKPRPKNVVLGTYGTAQKMRAAVAYTYANIHSRGRTPWNPVDQSGNPSLSDAVSDYFPSLRRRKVKAGDRSVPSKTLTDNDIAKIYDYTESITHYDAADYDKTWGGRLVRLQTHSINTMGEALLLRSAEVLQIKWDDIEFGFDEKGAAINLKIIIPTRKNDQYGTKANPSWIHLLPDQFAHRCAFRGLCTYLHASTHTAGYLYPRITKGGELTRRPLSGRKYLENLRHSLMDVNIDPQAYGTHCLRRGGAQWLHRVWGVKISELCHWGCWVNDYKSPNSVWRYLIALVDEDEFDRKSFCDPKAIKGCPTCRRSCQCFPAA
ncbi:hypothetical protein MSAN_00352100 [Mycena sanguinolenta]|uniref:Tyr recombinase domain-containing protein n=1 Tax=Mycena sanguinolenta TaxID=230812 RepID=A0A8H6ZD23_9AGAR|nr:hypothetical protein MSAN_00352100 [Mycena sanguinolenta]